VSKKKKEFQEKREKRRFANRVVIGVVVVLFAFIIVSFAMRNSGDNISTIANRWEGGTYNIGKQVDYLGKRVAMTDIELQVDKGKVMFPVEAVVDNSFIYSEYTNERTRLPLMAFISPSGRLVAAVSYCEPCRSESFHIDGRDLVCDSCQTKWQIADLKGISGGCKEYAPEELNYEVVDGMVVIDEADILSWVPRSYQSMEG
jgi:uncharacterized membrane protein